MQGSFECVRSGGVRRLEACGPLPRRMRVQANDDSYEATKDRFSKTIAAEQSKWYRCFPTTSHVQSLLLHSSKLASNLTCISVKIGSDLSEESTNLARPNIQLFLSQQYDWKGIVHSRFFRNAKFLNQIATIF